MEIINRLSEKHNCQVKGCSGLALSLSEPPRCSLHIENPDAWFEQYVEVLSQPGIPEIGRKFSLSVAHDLYRTVLIQNPIRKEFYQAFKKRVDPRSDVNFSFEDIIYFAVAAAASGVIGNLVYDGLKTLFHSLMSRRQKKELEETFEYVVIKEHYEEQRRLQHGEDMGIIDAPPEIIAEIELKYELIIEYRQSLHQSSRHNTTHKPTQSESSPKKG